VLDGSKELLKNAPPPEAQVQKTITHLAEFGQSVLCELEEFLACIPVTK
jgi:hypothetical protein